MFAREIENPEQTPHQALHAHWKGLDGSIHSSGCAGKYGEPCLRDCRRMFWLVGCALAMFAACLFEQTWLDAADHYSLLIYYMG